MLLPRLFSCLLWWVLLWEKAPAEGTSASMAALPDVGEWSLKSWALEGYERGGEVHLIVTRWLVNICPSVDSWRIPAVVVFSIGTPSVVHSTQRRSERQKGNVSVTYGNVVSFMPQLWIASEWVEMLLDSSEQNEWADATLAYLYPDIWAWPAMQILHTQFCHQIIHSTQRRSERQKAFSGDILTLTKQLFTLFFEFSRSAQEKVS